MNNPNLNRPEEEETQDPTESQIVDLESHLDLTEAVDDNWENEESCIEKLVRRMYPAHFRKA